MLLATVPLYDSYPSGAVTLMLDFNGHVGSGWWRDGDRDRVRDDGEVVADFAPAFDLDGNPASFDDDELEVIRQVWQRVAEDFAPFNVNVTTFDGDDTPAILEDEHPTTIRVAIGGYWDDWYGQSSSGVGKIGTFTNSAPNVVYAFADTIEESRSVRQLKGEARLNRLAAYIATTASHEAGHAFGLEHQGLFDLTDGALLDEYYDGTDDWTPIMGGNLSADRTTWHNGAVDLAIVPTRFGGRMYVPINQDNMAVIAQAIADKTVAVGNDGYRPDDHSDSARRATVLDVNHNNEIYGGGIVGTMQDKDYFTFRSPGGHIALTIDVLHAEPALDLGGMDIGLAERIERQAEIRGGANLDAMALLYDSQNRLLAYSDASDRLNARIEVDAPMGEYRLVVASHGKFVEETINLGGRFENPRLLTRLVEMDAGEYGSVGQYTISGLAGSRILPPREQANSAAPSSLLSRLGALPATELSLNSAAPTLVAAPSDLHVNPMRSTPSRSAPGSAQGQSVAPLPRTLDSRAVDQVLAGASIRGANRHSMEPSHAAFEVAFSTLDLLAFDRVLPA